MADLFKQNNIAIGSEEPVDLFEQKNIVYKPSIEKTPNSTIVKEGTYEVGEDEFRVSTPRQRLDWAAQGAEGWWEYSKKTLGSDLYYGSVLGVASLKGLVDRLQENEYPNELAKEKDMADLKKVMLRKEEMQVRGSTWGKNMYRIVAQIPAFAYEFYATRGLASSVRGTMVTTKAGAEVVKKGLIRKGAEVLAREAVVGAARTLVMPHRYVSGYNERNLNEQLSITDKGLEILDEAETQPVVAFIKSFGDSFVEYNTETLGGELLKPMGKVVGKGILSRMPEASRANFIKLAKSIADKIPEGRMTDLFSQAGFNGILEEYGEERLGALARIVLGLDEREDMTNLDKLQEAIFPGWGESLVEVGAFSVWGGVGASSQIMSNYLQGRGKSDVEIERILKNLSQKEKDEFVVNLGANYDERVRTGQIIVKAAAGADLTESERGILDRVYEGIEKEKVVSEEKETIPVEEKITQKQAQEIIVAGQKQAADIKKKISLLYQGREKQLDQQRVAIEKEMSLLEQQRDTRKNQKLSVKAIESKLDNLQKKLDSIHYQIADLEDTGVARLEKEGITIKGAELESLRNKAFRQGEIGLRKDLMSKIIAKRKAEKKRERLVKKILNQPKRPENVVDVKYQKQINDVLAKLGDKKQTRRKSLKGMSIDNIEKLAGIISSLKEEGRNIFKAKQEQRKMASEILRAALIKAAGGTTQGMFSKGSIEERKKKRASGLKKADLSFLRPLRAIRILLGKTGENLIYDSIDTADMVKGVFALSRKKAIDETMKKNNVSLFDLGSTISINGKSYQLNNVLRMYLATKDKKSYEALLNGNKLTEEEVQAFVERVHEEFPSYIKFADDVQKIVSDRYDVIAETMAEYFNVSVEKVKVYFPLRRIALGVSQEELNQGIESEAVFEQVLRKGKGFAYTSTEKGFTISRKEINEKFQTEISLDFIGDAYRTIDKQEHLIAYAPLQKVFNKLLNDPALQESIKYNHSESAWKWLNDYLLTNINPDMMYQGGNQWGRFVNSLMGKARRGLTKAYLGFNAVTSLKQLPSLTLALKYTNPKELAISMERISLSKEARNKVYELDPSLKNRVISRDFEGIMKAIKSLPEGDIKRQLMLTSQKIDKVAFSMIMQMDKYAVLSVYDSVYRCQRKTKSEEEAKNIAHKAVLETQPQGGVKDLPEIYRTNNEFIRMVLMFSNQLNQMWNMVRADLPQEIAQKEYKKGITGIASIMVSSILIYIMSHGRLPEDLDDFFDAIFGNIIASVPILGQWGMSFVRGYEPSISPATSIMNNTKWMLSNLKKERYDKAFKKSLFLLAIYLELPYAQPKRTIEGIYDLVTGETEDFRRLIWGEYSLENQ